MYEVVVVMLLLPSSQLKITYTVDTYIFVTIWTKLFVSLLFIRCVELIDFGVDIIVVVVTVFK